VIATYRSGSGPSGMVAAGSLQLLLTRPFGVRSVTNPQPPSGAAAPERTEAIKENAPLSIFSLGRIVSLNDYQAFAGAFAGIAKASARSLLIGGAPVIHLTIAGEGGAPIPPDSSIFQNLRQSLSELGDPTKLLLLDDYRPRKFKISAQLILDPRYSAALVRDAVAVALNTSFAFTQRDFGQPVRQSEVIHIMQRVPGVRAVLLHKLYYSNAPSALASELTAESAGIDESGQSTGAELLVLDLSPQTDLGGSP